MESGRRSFLAGAAAAGAVSASPLRALAKELRQPNFLFIMADDMGWGDLSCYGQTLYETPALDRLAREGIQFTEAYSNSAVCSATRVALMTGRYQYRLPIGLEEPLALRKIGLPPSHPTIASQLRSQGYATSLIGKWHLGPLPDYGPLLSGYDEFWGIRGGGVDYFTHDLGPFQDLWDGNVAIERAGYLTDLLADRAIAEIEKNARLKKPFFMSLHFTAPHWPWEGPGDEAESQRLAASTNPMAAVHADGGSIGTYAAMMTRLDQKIGDVLAALKRLRLDSHTVVVFTSDNGGERFSRTWPLSGKKSELLEGGIRVPCIVRWPGLSRAGSTSTQPIISMDFLPTFLAGAGAPCDAAAPPDGVDIRPAIAGKSLAPRPLFWRYKFQAQRALRLGEWKYLSIGGNDFLFNLHEDVMERANKRSLMPDKFAEMAALWAEWDKTMLPLDPQSASYGLSGDTWVDRNGGKPPQPPGH